MFHELKTYTPPQGLWAKDIDHSNTTYSCLEIQKHFDDFANSEEADGQATHALLLALGMVDKVLPKPAPESNVVGFYKVESCRVIGMYLTFPGIDRAIAIDLYLTEDDKMFSGYHRHVGIVEERRITPV